MTPSAVSPKGRAVSLINMKGGVGKTTLAVRLSWELAKGRDVVLLLVVADRDVLMQCIRASSASSSASSICADVKFACVLNGVNVPR